MYVRWLVSCVSADEGHSPGKDSSLHRQATAVQSSARQRQSSASAVAENDRLPTKRSRSGRRSVKHARTDEGEDTAVEQREGVPAVVVKRGRGRPRKVCTVTLMRQYLTPFL